MSFGTFFAMHCHIKMTWKETCRRKHEVSSSNSAYLKLK